jgi:hypothetical protein
MRSGGSWTSRPGVEAAPAAGAAPPAPARPAVTEPARVPAARRTAAAADRAAAATRPAADRAAPTLRARTEVAAIARHADPTGRACGARHAAPRGRAEPGARGTPRGRVRGREARSVPATRTEAPRAEPSRRSSTLCQPRSGSPSGSCRSWRSRSAHGPSWPGAAHAPSLAIASGCFTTWSRSSARCCRQCPSSSVSSVRPSLTGRRTARPPAGTFTTHSSCPTAPWPC